MNSLKIIQFIILGLSNFCIWLKIFQETWKKPGGWKGTSTLWKSFHGRGTHSMLQVLRCSVAAWLTPALPCTSSACAGTYNPQRLSSYSLTKQLNDTSWLFRRSLGIRAYRNWRQEKCKDTNVLFSEVRSLWGRFCFPDTRSKPSATAFSPAQWWRWQADRKHDRFMPSILF